MAVTFSLPTVLARLADGQATIDATGETLGEVVAEIADRFPRLAPRLRDETGGPVSVRHVLSERRGHPLPQRVRDAGELRG